MNREPDLDEVTLRVKGAAMVAKRRAERESRDGIPVALDRTLDGGHVVSWTTEDLEDGEPIVTRHRVTYREPLEAEDGV